jgi:alpha-tubulin suppressor-like RCC1 family protein
VTVTGLASSGVTALSAGYFSACALVDGRVACWGMNEWDQLGGAAGSLRCGAGEPCCGAAGVRCRASAVTVDGLDAVDGVATQGYRAYRTLVAGRPVYSEAGATCVVERAHTVRCWGEGRLVGVAGRAGANVIAPGEVIPSLRATAVAMGFGFVCALEEGGTVACWGANGACQLGSASDGGAEVQTPQRVPGLTGVRAIAAGSEHVCALRDDGEALCWGQNGSGELGQGMSAPRVCEPALVQW